MKMTSVNKASKVCPTSNLSYSNDSKYSEFSSASETSEIMHSKSYNDSYICTKQAHKSCEELNKSELDLEIEMCEDLLNSNNDKENVSEFFNVDLKNMHASLEVQNDENVKCDKINENTTLFSKTCLIISSDSNKHLNILNNGGQPSDNALDSTISVLEKQYSLNLDIEILRYNDDTKELENSETNILRNSDFENQDIKNNAVKVALKDQPLDIVPDLTLSVLENSYSTNLGDISKCNSEIKYSIENDDTSTLNDHSFKNDIDPSEFSLDEKDHELSLFVETDDSMLLDETTEFEISILNVEEHFSSNEILVPSIKVEEDKTVSSIVPSKSSNEQIKEDERDDVLDPRWDKIKQLSTDEERYQQVKSCWKSRTVPDPNKNLTYHSYRKRHFNTIVSQPKQRKRMASNTLSGQSAKRSRSCTYHLDHQIQTVSAKERQETNEIMVKMDNEINRVNRSFQQEVQRHYDPTRGYNSYAFEQLQANLENKIASIKSQYRQQANYCINQVESEIDALNVVRNEVLQFYKFYKGLNSRNDPTVLTFEQNLELEEMENIYSKFNQLYE